MNIFAHKTFEDGSEWTPKHALAAYGLSLVGMGLIAGGVAGVNKIKSLKNNRKKFKNKVEK